MRAALHIDDLAMAYDGRTLFAGVSVDIDAGQRVIVTGSNGSGKTTLLKIIAGLVRPESGKVEVMLADGRGLTDADERRKVVGYAGPDVNVYDELSAIENLAFYAGLRGVRADIGKAILDRIGLKKSKQGDPVRTYSSGMRQRVRLAASLLASPTILLWDEPTAMLDEGGRAFVDDILREHAEAGGIGVIATNDPAEIDGWGDRRIHFDG